jgi:hypothetical protein
MALLRLCVRGIQVAHVDSDLLDTHKNMLLWRWGGVAV